MNLTEINPIALGLFLSALSLIPLLVIISTSFLKISMVLIILRNAIGIQQVPPSIAIYAIALATTLFIMAPVGQDIMHNLTIEPIPMTNLTDMLEGIPSALDPLWEFMRRQTNPDIALQLAEQATKIWPKDYSSVANTDDILVTIPAFVLSELQSGFKIGFLIYVPFFVIDLLVSNLLLALGMQMVAPITLTIPLKLLLFVIVDGWTRLLDALIWSYL